jgi:hypothetical protein
MMHYHGTPISPRRVLLELAGKNFCVSFAHPNDVLCCHQIGQSVMLDNGAFSLWTRGKVTDWHKYYDWCAEWLEYPTTWAVIPDVIDGDATENDRLVGHFPHPVHQSAPVWHLHEPTDRILHFLDCGYTRICFGSSGKYKDVGSDRWHHRITQAFNRLAQNGPIPWVHMLRGMSLAGSQYPFASVDSTDVARNHNRKNNAILMANRWDAMQCPAGWKPIPTQQELA